MAGTMLWPKVNPPLNAIRPSSWHTVPYCQSSHEARLTCSSIGVSQNTTGDSMSSTTRGAFTERCQAQCRLCFVPSWMICFEFSVQSSLDTFLVLIVLAAEVNRGQQKSASEKPSEEFEHNPKANKDTGGSRRTRHEFVYAWAKRLCL